jgi:hypothetical protein
VIVDWDVAGPWTAFEETAAAAVEWGGAFAHEPHRPAVQAMVDGYRHGAGPVAFPGVDVFAGWLVKQANWTAMHVRHALDDAVPEPRRRAVDRAVPELLEQLGRFTAGVPHWARWLDPAR